jgi:ATP-dependent RNA helicase RhlE
MLFSALRLAEPILRAVASEGYSTATPIQAQAIPIVLEGRDLLGSAQTGTGKTAAFALPILHRLSTIARPSGPPRVRSLILCPTRELATQISDSFRVYGKNLKLTTAVIFGGVGQNPQVHALRRGTDIIVATPGRLLDLMNQGHADLRGIEVLVLDEADRMLDMGFINDIRKIVAKLPDKKQTLFFSATMPKEIRSLADSLLRNAATVQVAPVATTADGVDESVYFINRQDKPALLAHLYNDLPMARTIVFTRTKRGADRVVKRLHASGIRAEAIHGDKTQGARERALNNFRANKTPVLVATDIASRGIDVDGITHVVNYDLSHEPETYVHRIGRTARAGASGCAISFCDSEEKPNLRAIEKLLRRSIPVKAPRGFRADAPAAEFQRSGERDHRESSHSASQKHSHSSHRSESNAHSHRRHDEPKGRPAAAHPTGGGVRPNGNMPAHAPAPAPARRAAPRIPHPVAGRGQHRQSHPVSRSNAPSRPGLHQHRAAHGGKR